MNFFVFPLLWQNPFYLKMLYLYFVKLTIFQFNLKRKKKKQSYINDIIFVEHFSVSKKGWIEVKFFERDPIYTWIFSSFNIKNISTYKILTFLNVWRTIVHWNKGICISFSWWVFQVLVISYITKLNSFQKNYLIVLRL